MGSHEKFYGSGGIANDANAIGNIGTVIPENKK